MKPSQRISDLKLQVRALQSLGFAGTEAVRMVARSESHRIKKSLPEINKPLPTPPDRKKEKWTEKTDRLNERQTGRPASKEAKPEEQKPQEKKGKDRNIKLQMKPRKPGDKRPLSPFVKIIEKQDGTKWMYVTGADGKLTVKQLDQYFVPTFVETKAGEEGTAEKGEQTKQPAKAEDKKESTKMQKSEFLNTFGRARNFNDIAAAAAGVKLPEPVQQNQSGPMNWKQNAVKMSPQEFNEYRLQQAREQAAEREARDKASTQTINASWMGPNPADFRLA